MSADVEAPDGGAADLARLEERLEAVETRLADAESDPLEGAEKLTLVATKGTLDMAFPPLNLANTAAAFGWEVKVFHTLWGLDIIHEERSKQLPMSAVGNPNMPVPNLVGVLPGMDAMAARMMARKMRRNGNAMIEDLVRLCLDSGVELIACGTTIDLMGYDDDEFYEGVTVGPGAPTAFQHMATSDIQLFI